MIILNTECPDQDVDCFTHNKATRPHHAVIPGSIDGDFIGHHRLHHVLPQVLLDSRRVRFIPGTLRNLSHHEIADDQRLLTG